MRATPALWLALALFAPVAHAGHEAPAPRFADLSASLTLGTGGLGELDALMALMLGGRMDAGERALLDRALADPLSLLELPDVPPALLARLTLRQLGPIFGAHVADVPPDIALAAAALARDPLPADQLRHLDTRASVRYADAWQQEEDLAAMLGRGVLRP